MATRPDEAAKGRVHRRRSRQAVGHQPLHRPPPDSCLRQFGRRLDGLSKRRGGDVCVRTRHHRSVGNAARTRAVASNNKGRTRMSGHMRMFRSTILCVGNRRVACGRTRGRRRRSSQRQPAARWTMQSHRGACRCSPRRARHGRVVPWSIVAAPEAPPIAGRGRRPRGRRRPQHHGEVAGRGGWARARYYRRGGRRRRCCDRLGDSGHGWPRRAGVRPRRGCAQYTDRAAPMGLLCQ